MCSVRPFVCADLLTYNNVNLDVLTETYGVSFYLTYLAKWPEYFQTLESVSGDIMGYIMGKAEGFSLNWHGHVTALSGGFTTEDFQAIIITNRRSSPIRASGRRSFQSSLDVSL